MTSTSDKQTLVIFSKSPYSSALAREGIDYCLAAAAFEQNIKLLFTGDAVLQLLKHQKPEQISQKNIAKTLSALPIYGINTFYVDEAALTKYELTQEHLCLPITLLSPNQMAKLLAESSTVLNF